MAQDTLEGSAVKGLRKVYYLTSRTNRALVGLALSLFVPSTGIFYKYLGIAGVSVYVALASFALFVGYKYRFDRFASKVMGKGINWLVLGTFLVLLSTFLVLYPIADSATVGPGSDNDEALDVGTTELLNGHYPYRAETYFGNPVGQLPGALLLAIPFVLLGNSAYQNLFWLFAFFGAMRWYLEDGRSALLLLWTIIALSPIIMRDLVTGDDKLANTVYILLFVLYMVHIVPHAGFRSWQKLSSAALVGIGLSSRLNFVLLLPLIFFSLVHSAGWKVAAKYVALTCAIFCVVTVPFYLYDPQGFGPMVSAEKLGQFRSIIPLVGIVIPLTAGAIALILSLYSTSRDLSVMFRNCAIVQAFPVLCAVVLNWVVTAELNPELITYGVFFLIFGAAAFWPILSRSQGD